MTVQPKPAGGIESPYAWTRLFVSLLLMTIGGSGVYTVSVVLPRIQTEFGVARGDASLPYSAAMIGFGLGAVFMGRLADRFHHRCLDLGLHADSLLVVATRKH